MNQNLPLAGPLLTSMLEDGLSSDLGDMSTTSLSGSASIGDKTDGEQLSNDVEIADPPVELVPAAIVAAPSKKRKHNEAAAGAFTKNSV